MFKNYFELLACPKQFDVDLDLLYKNYIKLQQEFHPDKQVSKAKFEIAKAAEYSAKINKAYEILKDEKKRAEYLLHLEGIEVNKDNSIDHDPIMLNEILELIENSDKDKIRGLKQECIENFQSNYANKNFEQAAKNIIKLQYLGKIN